VLDTQRLSWHQARLEGATPSPRNAALLEQAAPGALLYHGGWRAFQETYNDSFLLELRAA
jgi:hypothetical protein